MERYNEVKKVSLLGIIGNLFLFIIKLIVGIISGSQAMIADAFNSGSDIFSSVITFIGNKIASKPQDECHNLGHGKAEYIYAMIISIVMIAGVIIILKDSILTLIMNKEYSFSIYLIVVCIVTMLVKLSLYLYTIRIARNQQNLLLKANAKDHKNDMILAALNLISIIGACFNIYYLDGLVGIIISFWLLLEGTKIFRESYDVLMDKSISDEVKNEVLEIIKKYEAIKKINHFNSTPVGYKYQISLTIFVDGNLSTFDSHKIADDLEKDITQNIDEIYLAIIHVNPM